MARKAKTEGETNTVLANMKDRQEAITRAFDEILRTENDIDDAREQHIKPLAEAKTKLWRNLKADTGIERTDLELYYKIHKRNMLAQSIEGDDGQRILDNLREVFFALQKGGQLDFLDTVQDAA